MAGSFADLFGTTKSSFKVGKATFDASGLTAQRSITVPDKAGTLAMLSDITGGTSVAVQDEGTTLTSAATSLNFTGAGVLATNSGSAVTVNVDAGITLGLAVDVPNLPIVL